jgi:U3 small nucleolar RNA-associated protein 20
MSADCLPHQVVLELGAPNFGAVLHELKTSLTRGFQIHVLGYSVHYLLAKLVPTLAPGALDYCAGPLVQVDARRPLMASAGLR